MDQDQSLIPASLNLPLAYHKVKAHGQDPKQQRVIISQGNWLLIGFNNRTVWGWRENDRQEGETEQKRDRGLNKEWLKHVTQQAYWPDRNRNRERTTIHLHSHRNGQIAFTPALLSFFLLSRDFFSLFELYFVYTSLPHLAFFLSLLSSSSFTNNPDPKMFGCCIKCKWKDKW